MFYVYELTCNNTMKSYVGYTSLQPQERWRGHVKAANKGRPGKLYNAMRKHGKQAFSLTILAEAGSKAEALLLERRLIALHDTVRSGYNISEGGEGGGGNKGRQLSPEHRVKIGAAQRGKPKSEEHKLHMRGPRPSIAGTNNPFYGKRHSTETLRLISQREYARGEAHYLFGKPTPASFKAGALHPRSMPVTVNGVRYESISLATKATGLKKHHLRKLVEQQSSVASFQQPVPC